MKLDILSFSGDSALAEEYLKRNSAIQSAVNQLRTDLIFVDVGKSTVQTNLLTSSFRKLRADWDTFLNDYRSKLERKNKILRPKNYFSSFTATTGKPDIGILIKQNFRKI